jgi:hypothetical protein
MSVIWVVQDVPDGEQQNEVGILGAVRASEASGEVLFSGEFRETFQVLYQLRAEREGLTSYCSRCGSSEEREGQGAHHSFCRVPEEERRALLEASA